MTRFNCRSAMLTLGLAALVGCGAVSTTQPATKPDDTPAHAHPSAGPHGGPLVEWGEEELHLEVVIDRPAGTASVYVLGEDAKTLVPVATKTLTLSLNGEPPTVVTLTADPQESDGKDKGSSRFVGKHEAFKKDGLLSGSVSGEKDGKKYTGKFREKAPKK